MNANEIYKKAMEVWGLDLQIGVLAEECNELSKEILKYYRTLKVHKELPQKTVWVTHREQIIEEMVDTQIMLQQLFQYLDHEEVMIYTRNLTFKLARVERWLKEGEENEA
jgi:hypothetical protein